MDPKEEERAKKRAQLELEREERGLKLRDTKSRVKKYDRLKKKNKVRVSKNLVKCRHILYYYWMCRVFKTRS